MILSMDLMEMWLGMHEYKPRPTDARGNPFNVGAIDGQGV